MAIYKRNGVWGVRGTAAALGLLWASSVAQADYSYTFTLTSLGGNGADASGIFTLDSDPSTSIALFTSVNVTLDSDGNSYVIDQVIRGSNVSSRSIGAVFVGSGASLGIYGTPTVTRNEISGAVNTTSGTDSNDAGPSFFDAILTSGGSSGGGSSGGAPTPEVNAALGLTIAGATVAFLRRKRGGRSESATSQ